MIIVQQKPLQEIFEITKGLKRLLVLGCDGCASIIEVGGERQAKVLKSLLEMKRRLEDEDPQVGKAISILRQCDPQIVKTSLDSLIENYDVIISLSCGVGVQTLAGLYKNKTVIPGINTHFMGQHDMKAERFHELCTACGDCILHETGGVCPITRCAKSLLNGPCGGQSKGKCEVGGWTNDCAWVLIYNRLKDKNRLDLFTKFRPPRDYRVSGHPREVGGDAEESEAAT